jgi:N-acetylglucosaminyldiphosphoundecaprenol N-acetyl-beta-D-mannosaminyltransferase
MSTIAKPAFAIPDHKFRQILGLQFFTGSPAEAVEHMRAGGLLVVPAAPALKDLPINSSYREALLNADLTITDSGFMVLLWNLIQRDNIHKVSGLAYLRHLLNQEDLRHPGNTFWIMASPVSAAHNMAWLNAAGVPVTEENVYVSPMYGDVIDDPALIELLGLHRPRNIVVTIGGGTQERLGLYLKRNLDFHPAIHCIGAAIAFLSGDQVRIPVWADSLYLGWLFRCISQPSRYISRYWDARKLLPLLLRYRDQLPSSEI